jgi:Protein of unknown function (DUF4239)
MTSSRTLLFLTSLAPLPASLILVIIPTTVTILLTWVVRKKIGYNKLVINNNLAGIKYGIVGLAYVMLLTFATITVWDKFSLAQNSVIDEAGASRAIVAILNPAIKEEKMVLDALKSYLHDAIVVGWPRMAEEEEAPETNVDLQRLYKAARSFSAAGNASNQIASELFKHIDRINDARETRITLAKGIVPSLLWDVLIAGAVITISFSLFFGGESFVAQLLMTGMTTAMLLMALLIIVAFDHPFTGAISFDSTPLQMALKDLQ